MFTVALIGADGAGKTTIARRLENESLLPIKYLYMGVSPDASNVALPTTRLLAGLRRAQGRSVDMAGPPDPTRVRQAPKGAVKRLLAGLKSGLRLVNRLAEEVYRQIIAWSYQYRGYIPLFDRHFFSDYYAHDIANDDPERPVSSRIHGFFLKHIYPRPNLIIFLDAPASVLFARKGEGTIELLELRRQEYLQVRGQVQHFAVVDATQAEDEVMREVADLLWDFYRAHKGQLSEMEDG